MHNYTKLNMKNEEGFYMENRLIGIEKTLIDMDTGYIFKRYILNINICNKNDGIKGGGFFFLESRLFWKDKVMHGHERKRILVILNKKIVGSLQRRRQLSKEKINGFRI